jgi:hypothetical protein
MYKTLTLAAVAATAAATMTNSGTIVPQTSLTMNGFTYYSFAIGWSMDTGYGTQYNPSGPLAPTPDMSQSYALNVFSWLRLTFQHEIASSYMAIYDFTANLLDFTPYGQTVAWSRFDRGDGFAVTVSGFRTLNIANFNTRVRENAKTCLWSAFTSTSMMPDCSQYNQDKWTDYQDPVWQFNTGAWVANQLDTMDDNTMFEDVYGPHQWYTETM